MNELIQEMGGPLKFLTTLGTLTTWIFFTLILLVAWIRGWFHSDAEFQRLVKDKDKADSRADTFQKRYDDMWTEAVEARHDTVRLREIVKELTLQNGQLRKEQDPKVQT